MKVNISPVAEGIPLSGYLCLPRASSLDAGDVKVHHPDWRLTTCSICGAACYTSPDRENTLRNNPKLTACCTMCALKAGFNQPPPQKEKR